MLRCKMLRCKKDLIYNSGIPSIFVKDKLYKIQYTRQENNAFLYVIMGERNISAHFSQEKHKAWKHLFKDYFYSEAELRQLKLDKI